MFSPEIESAAKAHAVSEYPNESCGLIVAGEYKPCCNIAENPKTDFLISAEEYPKDGTLQGVIHSHPDGNREPSKADMIGQLSTAVPWGLMTVSDDGKASDLLWWGEGVPIPKIKGRVFRWGPSGSDNGGDCYALIKDWYRLERNIILPEYPREYMWWSHGESLYLDNFRDAGFTQITQSELQPGDVILMRVPIRAETPNHAGIYLGPTEGLLHHLMNRLSRQENIVSWYKNITHYLRYTGGEVNDHK